MGDTNIAGTWASDEIRRFFRAYQKYGSDFYKVSKMVGGGKAPEVCAALWRRHQEYFSLNKDYITEQGFLAEVQDNGATKRALLDKAYGRDSAADVALVVDNGAADEAYGLTDLDGDDSKHPDEGEPDEVGPDNDVSYLEASAAAAVVAMASPGKPDHSARGEGSLSLQERARRTPKRAGTSSISPGKRTPSSTAKRARANRHGAADDGDIYEYYDEGMVSITESARKRRKAQARLEFGEETIRNPAPIRRRQAADEKGGVMALLSLAEAGSEEDTKEGGEGFDEILYSDDVADDMGDVEEDDDEYHNEEEDDVLGVMMDDDRDEDYRMRAGKNQRRVRSNRNRPRPAHGHTTPRRMMQRIVGSGLGSPGWTLGLEGHDVDLLGDLGVDPPSYLASPGLPPQLPPGFVASPKNPMPRLRPRKRPFERRTVLPHLKSLFGRRPHLGSSTLVSLGGFGSNPTISTEEPKLTGSPTEQHVHRMFGSRLRRWAIFEFFYSAIDRPWFMNETMSELLAHMGLPEKGSLTRKEWTVLRSSLGRPRRLSWAFLRDCRAKLEAHRTMAREAYGASVLDQNALALLPRPVVVGQRVIARHPATRQLHDGSVLTVAPDSYRIQFDRRELGVEVIRDIDVMPSEPWENLPMAMLAARPRMVIGGKLVINGRPVKINNGIGSPNFGPNGGPLVPSSQRFPPIDSATMAELATNLDRKEALLVQLRQMNDEAGMGVHTDPTTGAPKPAFLQAYSSVILKLREVNETVVSKIAELERGPSGTAEWMEDLTGPMEGARLPAELLTGPITAQTLAAAALNEARRVCVNCKARLSQSMASRTVIQEALRAQAHHDPAAWGPPTVVGQGQVPVGVPSRETAAVLAGPSPHSTWISALEPIIEGAVWTLALLQQGADRLVPAPALALALDSSILSVKPKSVANAALYTEIEAAMKHLKLQLA